MIFQKENHSPRVIKLSNVKRTFSSLSQISANDCSSFYYIDLQSGKQKTAIKTAQKENNYIKALKSEQKKVNIDGGFK